jgi:hypothetical protein
LRKIKQSGKLFHVAKRKNPAAVALGRKGGKARLKTMTPEERSEIARKAGKAGGRGRKKSAFRIWVQSGKVPSWGAARILDSRNFLPDGWDVVVAGDGSDLVEHMAAHPDVFSQHVRDAQEVEGFSFEL